MSEPKAPKIEFPCENYPIKILGKASDVFREAALAVMEKHAPGYDRNKVTWRASGKGTFISVTVYITATGVDQLQALFEDLKKHPDTRMVL